MAMTEAQKRAQRKYKAKARDIVAIETPKGYNEKLKRLAALSGKSKARYIMDAIAAQADKDGHGDILADTLDSTPET